MTFPANPAERQPKSDHNRRLSLGLDAEDFAAAAGITVEELKDYENTWPDHKFSPIVAERVGVALERLENQLPNSEAAGIRQVREGEVRKGPVDLAPEETFEQQVRDTAYFMWEADGRPSGRDEEYWHRAREACMGQFRLDEQFEEAVQEDDPRPMSASCSPLPQAGEGVLTASAGQCTPRGVSRSSS